MSVAKLFITLGLRAMTKGGHLLFGFRSTSFGNAQLARHESHSLVHLLRGTLSAVRPAFFLSAFVFGILPACSSAPPPHEEHVAPPVKPIVSASASTVSSTPPNPPPLPVASAAPPPPEPPDPPEPPPNADTTLALGDGTDFVVDLSKDVLDAPELALELRRENKVILRREGFNAITHFDMKKLHPCDTWATRVIHEDLGASKAVRVSLVCRTGEDYFTGSEIAVLVKPDDLKTIWAGLADKYVNSMDSCIEARHVTFRIVPPKTLEKSILTETTWVDQVLDDDFKARLKRDCKLGKQTRIEKIALP